MPDVKEIKEELVEVMKTIKELHLNFWDLKNQVEITINDLEEIIDYLENLVGIVEDE